LGDDVARCSSYAAVWCGRVSWRAVLIEVLRTVSGLSFVAVAQVDGSGGWCSGAVVVCGDLGGRVGQRDLGSWSGRGGGVRCGVGDGWW
jgi:hypothetical protein